MFILVMCMAMGNQLIINVRIAYWSKYGQNVSRDFLIQNSSVR